MNRLLPILALLAAAAPRPAAARPVALQAPDLAAALRRMDELRAHQGLLPQTVVVPERPGQNQVAWYDFDWRYHDIPSPSGGKGGVRLYYYARAQEIAERALPSIRASFLWLVDQFHYSPSRQIPYILYATKREFLSTNIFEVGESVLGVTSPRDLKMSLPYFGDHERFREVSTHEMVHQFTIQKLLDIAGADELSFIEALPLWFIEGIAEYYSRGGLDPESDAFLRDLVWNPDPEHHYEVLPFAEDRLRGYVPTYKLGQARVAFVAEVYGREKIQAFLENAYAGGGSPGGQEKAFAALVRRVLNEPLEQVDTRWRAWLKRRYYPDYLRVRQDLPLVRDFHDLPSEPERFTASPDGWLVLYRGLDRQAGRVRLQLFDLRWPRGAVTVAEDHRPGVESLHPVEQGVMALAADKLAFAAQDGPGDSLYLVPIRHTGPAEGRPPRLSLGSRTRLPLRHPAGHRFVELGDLAFSADGSHLAFVGLTDQGQRDIYVVPVAGGTARQVTDDPHAERDLAWGRDGLYCSSDATDDGAPAIFRVDAASGQRVQLTSGPGPARHPVPQADGSVLFSAVVGGKPDLFLLKDGAVRRLSDFTTGLAAPAPAPGARGILASTFHRGRFRLVELPRAAWLEEPPEPVVLPPGPPLPIPREAIPPTVERYRPFALGNWRPEAGIVYGGGGVGGVAGRAAVLFADLMRDRSVMVDLAVYGSIDFTQGTILYEDRKGRTALVAGLFHFVNSQVDRLDQNLAYYQREFGLVGALRHPLDRFRRVDLELQVGGIQRYCLTDYGQIRPVLCSGADAPGGSGWRRDNGGVSPSVSPAVRLGYDTTRLDPLTGPIDGTAASLELGGGWLPTRSALHGFARAELGQWFQLGQRSSIMLRGAAGSSFAPDEAGRRWARAWWLTSADNLRGFSLADTGYLVGRLYYVANAELQFPVVGRFLLFEYVEGVAALDFGGVADDLRDRLAPATSYAGSAGTVTVPGLWSSRTLTGVLGVNTLLGPLLLRLHFGHPFDIGGQRTPAQQSGTRWVTNLTIRYLFF